MWEGKAQVLAPRSTLTSKLTWSEGLMPAYYKKGTYVSPQGPLALPTPDHPWTQCTAPSVTTWGRREGLLCPLSSPQVPLNHPKLKAIHHAFPHAVLLSEALVHHLQLFSLCKRHRNKDS